jgi:cell division inhibitor SulA
MSKTSVNARLAMIQAFANFMDSGSQSATVVFYEDTQPVTPLLLPILRKLWSRSLCLSRALKK